MKDPLKIYGESCHSGGPELRVKKLCKELSSFPTGIVLVDPILHFFVLDIARYRTEQKVGDFEIADLIGVSATLAVHIQKSRIAHCGYVSQQMS
jgi:hypothetical protein